MSDFAVGENYAGALLDLATRRDAAEEYGRHLAAVAGLYREEPRFRLFLDTPRVPEDRKKEVLREVLSDRVPKPFLHFLLVVLDSAASARSPASRRPIGSCWTSASAASTPT
jgi:F0F1-type ATP synthase delta subunit